VSLFLLASFAFAATVLSVLAIRPKMIQPPTSLQPGMNVVFFGTFSGMPQEEYVDHMIDLMRSEEAVYRAMARDLYQNGRVLQTKKYRYLSWAYTTFLAGLGATAVAFVIEQIAARIAA
jgi:hypothetical protein